MIPDDPTGRWHLDDLQQESRRLVLGPRGSRGRGKFVAVNLLSGRLSSGCPLPSFLILILFIFIVPAKKGTVLAFLPAFFVCLCRVGSRTGP